jgi:hypothetical protein
MNTAGEWIIPGSPRQVGERAGQRARLRGLASADDADPPRSIRQEIGRFSRRRTESLCPRSGAELSFDEIYEDIGC